MSGPVRSSSPVCLSFSPFVSFPSLRSLCLSLSLSPVSSSLRRLCRDLERRVSGRIGQWAGSEVRSLAEAGKDPSRGTVVFESAPLACWFTVLLPRAEIATEKKKKKKGQECVPTSSGFVVDVLSDSIGSSCLSSGVIVGIELSDVTMTQSVDELKEQENRRLGLYALQRCR